MTTMTDKLTHVLADTYLLYLKTQVYHWNVTGPHFHSLHLLFENQYKALAIAIDDIAERIRALGEFTPSTYKELQSHSTLNEPNIRSSSDDMIEDLYHNHTQLVKILQEAHSVADKIGDTYTADLMSLRIGTHQKDAWMLASMVQKKEHIIKAAA